MGSYQRFLLLLACALTAALAFGALPHRGEGRPHRPDSVRSSAAERRHTDEAKAATPSPTSVLGGLWAITVRDRFPQLATVGTEELTVLADSQIVSYYGNPYTADMGILGQEDLETVVAQLERHAARYDELNGPTDVIPAIHLVYAVAQYHPTDNGNFLQYVDDDDVRRYVALTEERGMLLFLDVQIGRSSVAAELPRVLPYLRSPQVHLAIDPEFAVSATEVPGDQLGSLRAADIDEAQAALQELVDRERLPPKLLIVHQFSDSMVLDGEEIRRYRDVELIVDMDGFGPAAIKRAQYQQYASRPYATYAGIKLFFQHDPDLMSEEDVLLLKPRPAVVIYQ